MEADEIHEDYDENLTHVERTKYVKDGSYYDDWITSVKEKAEQINTEKGLD